MPPVEPNDTASSAQGRDEVIAEDTLSQTHRDAASAQVVTREKDSAHQAQVPEVEMNNGREVDAGGRVGCEIGGGEEDERGMPRAGAVACERGDGLKGDEVQLGGAAVSASKADVVVGDGAVATLPNLPHSHGASLEYVITQRGEMWEMEPKKKLQHSTIIVEQGYRIYQILIPRGVEGIFDEDKPLLSDLGLDLEQLMLTEEAKEVPLDAFPRYSAEDFGSEQRCLSDESVYIKRPDLTPWNNGIENRISEPMESEGRAFQVLAKSPHKNIVQYKGCVVRNGRVIALCLGKLKCNLSEAVQNKELLLQLDNNRIMSALRSAVAHLHELGICHNDIQPANVMLDSNNDAILIDMDSSKPVGDKLMKGGSYGWAKYDDFVSAKRNDTDSLAKLEAFLLKGTPITYGLYKNRG